MRPACALLVAGGCLLLAGCDLISRIDTRAYLNYHASRWSAVVEAYVLEQPTVSMSDDPPAPRVCTPRVEPAYKRIVTEAHSVGEEWAKLSDQSRLAVQFTSEMLDVLVSRDTFNIEKLAPQIDDYVGEHARLHTRWHEQREAVAAAVTELDAAWTEVWPEHECELDLPADAARARVRLCPSPLKARADALAHYHENEYNRLAMIYLDYQPVAVPNPVSHVPADCDELSMALRHLEAGLLVRYSMDQAIERDVDRVVELARVDLSETPWENIRIPKGRYARPRVTAAIARLKLLKYLDSLLTGSLDVLVGDVELQWRRVWPNHRLETNIFAFAGLTPVSELPPDPLDDHTFRR